MLCAAATAGWRPTTRIRQLSADAPAPLDLGDDAPGRGLPGVAEAAEVLATSQDLDLLLATTCRVARAVTGARYAALGVIGDDQLLARFVHDGIDEATARRIGPLPTGGGVLGVLVRDPRTLRLDDVGAHPASQGFPANHPPMATFLGTPVRAGGEVFGNLYLTDKPSGFDQADEDVVKVLAAQAGAAIASLRLRGELEALALQEERDRIARDLHDHAIQRLFATVMLLDGVRPHVAAERLDVLEHAVTQVQEVIADLRRLTHDLHEEVVERRDLQARVVAAVRDHEATTGVRPRLRVDAALPGLDLPAHVVDDLAAVLAEALSNVARHAEAGWVEVRLDVADGHLALVVADDGHGAPTDTVRIGRGLDNVRARIAAHEGHVALESEHGVGTVLRVDVPIAADEEAET